MHGRRACANKCEFYESGRLIMAHVRCTVYSEVIAHYYCVMYIAELIDNNNAFFAIGIEFMRQNRPFSTLNVQNERHVREIIMH